MQNIKKSSWLSNKFKYIHLCFDKKIYLILQGNKP